MTRERPTKVELEIVRLSDEIAKRVLGPEFGVWLSAVFRDARTARNRSGAAP